MPSTLTFLPRLRSSTRVASLCAIASASLLLCICATVPASADEAPHTFELTWGSLGSAPGQFGFSFIGPRGIAVDPAGNVYVADTENDRIQKFDSDGVFLLQWGSSGSGDGQFSFPGGVATDELGDVYVVDTFNDRVQKFANDGTFLAKWGSSGSGDGAFLSPEGIATDRDGHVYVADTGNARIQKFDDTGTFLTKWGSAGSGPGQFAAASGLATDAAGNVYVAEAGIVGGDGIPGGGGRIQKFTSDGVFLQQIGSLGEGPGEFTGFNYGVAVLGGNVYATNAFLGNPIQKFTTGGAFLTTWSSGNPADVAVDAADRVYVLDAWGSQVQRFAPPPPSLGSILSTVDTPGSAVGVDVVGNAAYVADASSMRQIIVNDPTMPVDFASFPTPGAVAENVAVSGTYAYIAHGLGGLIVVNHSNMMQVGMLNPPAWDNAQDVEVDGSTAYVANGSAGLRIVDISTPSVPAESGFFDTGGFAYGVTVAGDLVYVADDSGGLRIIDVSNPAAPFEVGFAPTSNAEAVAIDGAIAYVADRGAGLRVIDVSDPAAPVELALFDTPGTARGVDVYTVLAGTFVVVADFTGKLQLFDATDPGSVSPLGSIDSVGNPIDIQIVGDLAYVAGAAGLQIVELAFPATEFIGPDPSADVALYTPYLSVADSPWALGAVDFSAGYFHLEDFETNMSGIPITTPGATGLIGGRMTSVCCPNDHDSVDADDGAIDGSGLGGESWYAIGSSGVRFEFDEVVLGSYPTHAGFVFTDGSTGGETLTFEAYDPTGASLGILTASHVDPSVAGETDEDRFFGAVHLGGISAVRMSLDGGGTIEIDHLQYGNPVPEPSVGAGLTVGVLAFAGLARRRRQRRR